MQSMASDAARGGRLPAAVGVAALLVALALLVAGAMLLREAAAVAVAGGTAAPSPLLEFTLGHIVVPLLGVAGDPDPAPAVVAGWLRATLWIGMALGATLLLLAVVALAKNRAAVNARDGP